MQIVEAVELCRPAYFTLEEVTNFLHTTVAEHEKKGSLQAEARCAFSPLPALQPRARGSLHARCAAVAPHASLPSLPCGRTGPCHARASGHAAARNPSLS